MTEEPDWVPPGVDTKRANVARVYDYLLGGSHNFLADQDVARAIAALEPNARGIARANRAFLGRAVRFLSAAGIGQFLDIGSGIPTEGNVHEVAQQADPGARVAYVDVKFGAGAVDEIGFDMAQHGARRVLILTDPKINELGIPARIAESLTKQPVSRAHGMGSSLWAAGRPSTPPRQ